MDHPINQDEINFAQVVTPDIISKLGIYPIGKTKVNTPSDSEVDCNVYKLVFHLPNNVRIESFDVIEAPMKGQPYPCLIGRDILRYRLFIYNRFVEEVTFGV